MEQTPAETVERDRLLPWIAAERGFRSIVLLSVGIVLLANPHTNWASEITHLAQRLGLNPKENWIQKVVEKVSRISPNQGVIFGLAAIGYGVLEGAESYGLWTRRRWGEWLTVIATSLLFIPEVWALTKSATLLTVGALLVNIAVVVYLLWRLRRRRAVTAAA